ncbi:MAG: CcoQ/FixQ family Cbb3-type cytochrome c oxidase assembly chaperone [Flavobacteriales bacterium]|nr:CcoQ/FixQ family Cbb3-type cytochrome c oxidase assembly chaperone [Flavobacteriales bacterium]
MLKFIKHHLDTINGIDVFPVTSFILFFGFFLCMLWWVRKVSSSHFQHMSELPLGEDPSPSENTTHAI